MRRTRLLWIIFCFCLSFVQILEAQDNNFPTITAENAIALEQIASMGGDQGRIALSADNHWLAVGGLQGVWIFDLDAGDSRARLLEGHSGKANAVEFHPTDNHILASAGDDGTIRLWNVEEGENIRNIEAQSPPIVGIDFDETGAFIASAGGDTVRIFRVETGELMRVFANVPQEFRRVEFLNDSPLLIAATRNESLAIWNLNESRFVGETNNGFNGDVRSVASTHDGTQIAVALFSGRVITSTVATGEQLILDYHDGGVRDVAYSPDGDRLASVGMDNYVLIMDASSGDLISRFELDDFTYSVTFSHDSRLIYVASNDGIISTWDIASGRKLEERTLPFPSVRQVVFSPDGGLIAAVTDDDSVGRVFNAETYKQIAVLNGHAGRTLAIAYRPDNRLIVTAGSDGDVLVWRADTFKMADTLSTPEERVYSVAFSPDPNVIATGGDSLIRLWDIRSKEQIMALENGSTVWNMSFSPDGSLIAAPNGLWNAFDQAKIDVNIDPFASVAMSPNSNFLATTQKLIPIEPNRIRRAREGFVGLNNAKVAFSPDGTLVAMAVAENIHLVDVATQTVVAVIKGHEAEVRSLAFSPDGTKLVSGGSDATIRLWAVTSDVPEHDQEIPLSFDGLVLDIIPTEIPTHEVTETTITANNIGLVNPRIIRQSISNVVDFDVAPDGSSAVLASLQGVFYLDMTDSTRPPIAMLPIDQDIFPSGLAVDYSVDGSTVVVSHGFARSQEAIGGGITLWNLIDGVPELADELIINGDRGFSVALSTNKQFIAIGFNEPKAQILDVNTGTLVSETQPPLFGRVVGLTFSPDDRFLSLSDTTGNKAIFRTATGELLGGFNSGIALPMLWTRDNTYLYSAEQSGFLLRDGTTADPIRENPYPNDIQGDIKATDATNGQLIIANEDIIWFLDYQTGDLTQIITGFDSVIAKATVTDNGQQLFAITNDNRLLGWNIESGQQIIELELGFNDPQAEVALSNDGQFFAILNSNVSIRIFSAETGTFIRELETEQADSIYFLPNSTILGVTRQDKLLEFWDVEIGRLVNSVSTDDSRIIRFSNNGDYLITHNNYERLTLQNVRTGAILFDDTLVHLRHFNDADISTGENLMATAGGDGVVKLWDLDDGEQIALLRAHQNEVYKVAFSPQDNLLATMGADGVRVYDYRSLSNIEEKYFFNLPVGKANGLYFSIDGSLLFVHIAGELHVGSVKNGQEVDLFTLLDAPSILTADGRHVIVADEKGTIIRLTIDPNE